MNTIPGQTEGAKRLFHYTTISRLQSILKDGEIKLATQLVEPPEKPVVWFSFRQDWEPTATPALIRGGKRHPLTFDKLVKLETPARIEIDPNAATLDWRAWRKTSGVKPRLARALEEGALRQNANILDWRMSFAPVRVKDRHWFAIELFVRGQWQDISTVFGPPRQPPEHKT